MKHHDLDFLQAELSRVCEWVQFADKKAAFIAVFYSAIFGFLIAQKKEVLAQLFWHRHGDVYALLLVGLLALLVVGVYFLFATVSPRLKNHNTNRSLFYFGTVAKMKIEDFLQDIEKLTEEEARRQIAEQIHTNSAIADAKMANIKKSTQALLGVGVLLFLLFFL